MIDTCFDQSGKPYQRRRVVRRCPRCRRKLHHWVLGGVRPGEKRARLSCTDCGHVWPIRLAEDERFEE